MSSEIVFYAGRMLDHEFGSTSSWHYGSLSMRVRFRGEAEILTAFVYVDDATALIVARELLGRSKKWADIHWQREAGAYHSSSACWRRDRWKCGRDHRRALLPGSAVAPVWAWRRGCGS